MAKLTDTYNLASLFPEVAKFWHTERNSTSPNNVSPKTNQKFWWVCQMGHAYLAAPSDRVRAGGKGCPYCSGKMVCWDNCLQKLHPEVAAVWHKSLNGATKPSDITAGTHKKVWWQCQIDSRHAWDAPPSHLIAGKRCPYCAGKRVDETNSLAALHPEIAATWHQSRNDELTPDKVPASSGKKVFWQCIQGHEWFAQIDSRVRFGLGCPYCSNHLVSEENSLAAKNPELAAQWSPRNELSPSEVSCGSGRKIWWKCDVNAEHEWAAAICTRANGVGCPFCSRSRPDATTCVAATSPELLIEWDHDKNGTATLHDFLPGSDKKCWWLCRKGHSYRSSVKSRVLVGQGCPYCAGQKACKENCLATLAPYLAQEWHSDKNLPKTPNDVTPGSGFKAWWRCSNEHEWLAAVYSRAGPNSTGCPTCNKSKGETAVREFLIKLGETFTEQKTFNDCRGAKRPLPFDFYLPERTLCIEYDGEAHFSDSSWYEGKFRGGHGPEDFVDLQRHDAIKTNYCLANNIKLIRIPYWDIGRISEILTKELGWPQTMKTTAKLKKLEQGET